MMQLRKYQNEAVSAALGSLAAGNNPVLQLATGTGKSLIICDLASRYKNEQKRVWVLTHVKTLVKQNAATYKTYCGEEPGVVCSGLNRFDYDDQIIFATIQSIRNPALAGRLLPPDLIIIDEAHRVPHNYGEPGVYDTILGGFPAAQRVAMTATPWRMDNGIIYGPGEEFWFNDLAYKYTVPQAVSDGWLCPLVGVETEVQLDTDEIPVNGDFVQREAGEAETDLWLASVARSLLRLAGNRNRIALYCPTIESANRTARIIEIETGWPTVVVTGDMDETKQAEAFAAFIMGRAKVLCSVDMITTGFDYPPLDCIVCLRPTLSSSLWVQIQGRGTRLHPGKKNCLVLDYVGNLQRLGGVDMYEKFYRERNGNAVEHIDAKPRLAEKKKRRILPGVKTLIPIDPMTGQEAKDGTVIEVSVHDVSCVAITTRRSPDRPVLLVNYVCTTKEGARIDANNFFDTENPSRVTLEFFSRRSFAVRLPIPAKSIIWQVRNSKHPQTIWVRKSGRYWNVVEEKW